VCHLTQDGCTFIPNHTPKTQETLIEAVDINYVVFSMPALDMCLNKLITDLRLPVLVKCTKNARERSFADRALKRLSTNKPTFAGAENNMNNLSKNTSSTQVCCFYPCHIRPVSPPYNFVMFLKSVNRPRQKCGKRNKKYIETFFWKFPCEAVTWKIDGKCKMFKWKK
jgi:hypothetical protein